MRVILVDDEPLAREGMRVLLQAHPEMEIAGEAEDVPSAVALIRKEKPEAVFLDIQMPGANGFQLFKQSSPLPKVIFVTAHSSHAVKAFEVDAIDYLLKPVRPKRLSDALQRLKAALKPEPEKSRTSLPRLQFSASERLCLRSPERTVLVGLAEILAMEADRDFTRIFLAGQKPMLICQSLGEYEKTLPSPPFLRISRSLIVNLSAVEELSSQSREHATLTMKGWSQTFSLRRRARARLIRGINAQG